jgi:hypothetical protein
MSHDDESADSLPKRVAGASLPMQCPPPEGGWFGAGIRWPTEDLDERTRHAVTVLLDSELPDDSRLGILLHRLVDGLHKLVPPTPLDHEVVGTSHSETTNRFPHFPDGAGGGT